MSFSHVSRPIRTVTGKTFARKFITLGRVINYWNDAVGPELAAKTYPIGMKVHKAPAVKKSGTSSRKAQGAYPGPSANVKMDEGPGSTLRVARDDTLSPPPLILNATLEIAASSADATLIHYQKSLILERLRTLLGADMITDIKVMHTARPMTPALYTRPPKRGLTEAQKNSLSMDTGIVTDTELRAVLESFGNSMMDRAI